MKPAKITKEQIFEAAKTIANEQGLKEVTIRNVAKACDISIGSVYKGYETKFDLVFDVAKDYWRSVLDEDVVKSLPNDDFCDFTQSLYGVIGRNLGSFMREWVSVMSTFSAEEKIEGRTNEAEVFSGVKHLLENAIENDKKIDPKLWEETFDKQEMLNFIFLNMLNLLRQGSRNCDFLIKVLRKALY